MRLGHLAALVSASLVVPAATRAATILNEDFDGGSVNSTYAYTNSSGTPGGPFNFGGAEGNVAQLSNLSNSNNNSIAWNAVSIPAANQIVLSFDLYISNDAVNNTAGGCCNSAGDGDGIALVSTAQYGMTGPANPAAAEGFGWQGPTPAAGLALGASVFGNSSLNLQWNGRTIAATYTDFSLKNDAWNQVIITLTASGSDSLVSVGVIEDVNGLAIAHNNVLTGTASGLNIAGGLGTDYRLIAGGGTGSAWHDGYLDNVNLSTTPEPSAVAMLCFGGLLIHSRRRRFVQTSAEASAQGPKMRLGSPLRT